MHAFVLLSLVFSLPSQEIGLGERLRNELFCIEWEVKPLLSQSINYQFCSLWCSHVEYFLGKLLVIQWITVLIADLPQGCVNVDLAGRWQSMWFVPLPVYYMLKTVMNHVADSRIATWVYMHCPISIGANLSNIVGCTEMAMPDAWGPYSQGVKLEGPMGGVLSEGMFLFPPAWRLGECCKIFQWMVSEDISVWWLGPRRFVTFIRSAVYKLSYLLTYLLRTFYRLTKMLPV